MNQVHYTSCPVCSSSSINPLLTVKDHSISKEEFIIWQCSHCALRFTQDVPDEDSIGAYYQSEDYISHSNSQKGFINKAYQVVRNYTLKQKAKLIKGFTKEKGRILDVGAGTGAFLNTMKQQHWDVVGIEPDAGAREQAKKLFDLQLHEADTLKDLPPSNFDAITMWHVLEHVHQLHHYVERLKEMIKQDGKIFIAVPNYTSLDAELYGNFWAAYDVPRHLYHFSPQSMYKLMELHGLKIIATKPMWFDSFYVSLLSRKYKSGNMIAAGVSGLRSNMKAIRNKERCSSVIYIISKP